MNTDKNFRPCIVIPAYNPQNLLNIMLEKLPKNKITIFIIDDASTEELKINNSENIQIHRLAKNSGKGGAVMHGLKLAFAAGFTHVLQIDADNQHSIEDIPVFLELAFNKPQAMIAGFPVYNNNVPTIRKYGRKFTNLWINIETLSFAFKDAMCGFRVYPLEPAIKLIEQNKIKSQRMGFDIEIIVKLYWAGIEIINQKTTINYPENGVSHFRMFKDNLEISKVHCRLFFGMLKRIFSLLKRRS